MSKAQVKVTAKARDDGAEAEILASNVTRVKELGLSIDDLRSVIVELEKEEKAEINKLIAEQKAKLAEDHRKLAELEALAGKPSTAKAKAGKPKQTRNRKPDILTDDKWSAAYQALTEGKDVYTLQSELELSKPCIKRIIKAYNDAGEKTLEAVKIVYADLTSRNKR